MKKPDFFIVGAPKSGTTALYEYLRFHTNIFMARKEPHFFATDFSNRGIDSLDEYINLFADANTTHKIVGEASVWYLYSREAIKNIYQFNKNAKILAMLRNPVDLVYSKHAQLVYNCEEDEKSFKHAWNLQDERRKGNKLPRYVVNPEFLQYAQIGKLGVQIERLLGIFPRKQVKLILFEDFIADPKSVYEDVLSFLEIPSEGREYFPCINANKVARFKFLGRLLHKPSPFLLKIVKGLESTLGIQQLFLIDIMHKLNTIIEPRKPLEPTFINEMIEEFSDDIDKLSQILNRHLSHWKKS